MTTKLTLTMDKEVIQKAKKYAASHGRSLSQIAERYFSQLAASESGVDEETFLSPGVEKLRGILKDDDGRDYKEIIREIRAKKHG